MKIPVKNILILLYFLKDTDLYIGRLQHFGFSFSGLIYVIFFFLLLISVFAVAHIKNNFVRILLGVIFFVSAVAYDSYYRIMLEYLDYNAYINMIDAVGFAGEAFQQYILSYITSIGLGLILFIGIALKPKTRIISKRYAVSFPLIVFFLFTFLIFYKGGSGASGLPAIFTPLSYSTLALYEVSQDDYGAREDITIERKNLSVGHDIVYIIDESVAAQYLDINEKHGVISSLNMEYPTVNIYNFGYAASIANCSMSTNLTLRYGGTRDAYMKIIRAKPSIWQYAKNAGLKTIFIDAQRTDGELQNGMTDRELLNVDEFIQLDDITIRQRDQEVSRMIVDLINNDVNEFIIINKIGAHFPIHDKYPDDYIIYKPILHRGSWLDISDTGIKTGFNGSPEEWRKYRNSYRNTIEWNVSKFFSNIFENASLENTLIVYTSDHGQDLHERKNPGVNTHCSPNPNMEEGIVPLVIIEGKNIQTLNWQNGLTLNKDKTSHYNIFSTLLKVMHYETNEVIKIYGNTLDIETKDDFTFNSNWNSRLGQEPIWNKIELDKIARPSPNDYSNEKIHP